MPLGRQLAKIFNPGPAQSYNPDREALFAQMLASGSAPTNNNDIGGAIGNLAKFFVGQRGLKKQGQARDIAMDQQEQMEAAQQAQKSEAFARLLSGLGIDVDSAEAGILQENPNVMGEVMQRTRPQEPKAAPVSPDASKAVILKNPDTGETRPVFNQKDMQAAWSEGFRQPVEEPEAPRSFDKAREYRNPAGDVQWITNEAQRAKALGGGFAPYTAPKPAAAAPSENISPTNLTMPDGSTRLVQTRSELAEAQSMGATLPQGGTQQRPMNEKQINAQLATDRMRPAMAKLFEAGVDGTLFEALGSAEQRTKAAVPLVGNFLTSEAYKKADNLIREVVGSGLRFETGAAITVPEVLDQVLRYAPRPGDTQGVIEQKKGNLINYLESISKAVPQSGNETAKPSTPDSDPLGLGLF